jgi:signal transduction histidine kinase
MTRSLRHPSLRVRVAALAALAVLVVLTVAGTSLVLAQRAMLTESLDESLAQQADDVVDALRAGRTVTPQDRRSDDAVVQVVGPDGAVRVSLPASAAPLLGGSDPAGSGVRTVDLPTGAARLLTRTVGEDTVVVAGSLDDVEESGATLVRGLAIGIPLSTAVLAGIVWWAVGRALRPVDDIRARVDEISGSRLDRRVPETGSADEIARLARTMNAMLARLQQSAERQRAFVADASHELRSPVTTIRTELEVAQRTAGDGDWPDVAARLLREEARLEAVIADLLLLASLDDATPAPDPVLVDLAELAHEEARRRAPAEAEVTVEIDAPTAVVVQGNRTQLHRAFANLLDNAGRHARGTVRVAVHQRDGRARLLVDDDGPGIADADRERVFERFTRLDEHRARNGDTGGAGLGLSLVRGIADRHRGTAWVETAPLGGARLVLELPLADRSVAT